MLETIAQSSVMAGVVWQAIKDFFANAIEWLFKLTQSIGLPSYLLAIFIFTVIIKLLLQPMMNKQMRSSRKMQLLAPEVEELKRRYANNPQRQQQETMRLYKENGASPMAGCLPMLIQMPILIALFDALRNFGNSVSVHPLYPEFFHFLWWDNLAEIVKDGPVPWLLPIIAAAATFLQQYLTTPNIKDKQQRVMLIAFPLMFLFLVRSFPVLMAFYWIFYALIGVAIMYPLLRRWKRIDTAELEAKRQAKIDEDERRKAARKAAQQNYYKGKPRKEMDKNGKRGHEEELKAEAEAAAAANGEIPEMTVDDLPDEALTEEELEERNARRAKKEEEQAFKAWMEEGGYRVVKKKVKLHPYSPEPTVITLALDENGVEQDMLRLRQDFLASRRSETQAPITSVKDLLARRKQMKADDAKAEQDQKAMDAAANTKANEAEAPSEEGGKEE